MAGIAGTVEVATGEEALVDGEVAHQVVVHLEVEVLVDLVVAALVVEEPVEVGKILVCLLLIYIVFVEQENIK